MSADAKVVWITGASDGIGAALVEAYAQKGWKIVLSARNETKLSEVAKRNQLSEDNYLVLPFDLAQKFDSQELISKIIIKFLKIDVLILNAGISQKGKAETTQTSVEQTIMQVNYWSNVFLAKAVIPIMRSQGGGQIAVVSSIIGKFGSPFLSTYAASKHALKGYFESLRYEVEADNISILIVTPGFIKTDIAKKAVTESGELFNEDSKAQANGTVPGVVANKIMNAITRKKRVIYVGGLETWTPAIQFLFPDVFYWIWKKLHKL